MAADETIPRDDIDVRDVRAQVSWADYEAELLRKGERRAPRLFYLDGVLEVVSPSKRHEFVRFNLGALIATYAVEAGIELGGYGSWTLKDQLRRAGAEPDECFIIGTDQTKERPDLAIEVTVTSGGVAKLEVYRRLAVGEIWFWTSGTIEVFVLRGGSYERVDRSVCLPGIDLVELCTFLEYPFVTRAIGAYRAALASRR